MQISKTELFICPAVKSRRELSPLSRVICIIFRRGLYIFIPGSGYHEPAPDNFRSCRPGQVFPEKFLLE